MGVDVTDFSCEGELVVKTHADGTLETNIPEGALTERQKEFVEICRKVSEMQNAAKGQDMAQAKGMKSEGKHESNKEKEKTKPVQGREKRKLLDELKAEFKGIQEGMARDYEMLKESAVRPWRDLKKGMELISSGKFRELRDRFALRMHDNLQAMGVLPTKVEEKLKAANKRIEERLGYSEDKPRQANPHPLLRRLQELRGKRNQPDGRHNSQNIRQGHNNSGKTGLVPVKTR